jgi:hypothetical protein
MHINQDALGILSDADKQEFEVWQELLSSRGYKLLTEFLSEQQGGNQNVLENAANWDAYVYARGQRDALNSVLNLEQILEGKIQSIVDDHVDESLLHESNEYSDLEVNLGIIDE